MSFVKKRLTIIRRKMQETTGRNMFLFLILLALCFYSLLKIYDTIFNTNYFYIRTYQYKYPFNLIITVLKIEFISGIILVLVLGLYFANKIVQSRGEEKNLRQINTSNKDDVSKKTSTSLSCPILSVILVEFLFVMEFFIIRDNFLKLLMGSFVALILAYAIGSIILKIVLVITRRMIYYSSEIILSAAIGIINTIILMCILIYLHIQDPILVNVAFVSEFLVLFITLKIFLAKSFGQNLIYTKTAFMQKDIGVKEITFFLILAGIKCLSFMYTQFPFSMHWDSIGHARLVMNILLGRTSGPYGDINPFTNELPYALGLHYMVAFAIIQSNVNVIEAPSLLISLVFSYGGIITQFLSMLAVYSITFTVSKNKISSTFAAIATLYFSSIFMFPSQIYFYPQSLAIFFSTVVLLSLISTLFYKNLRTFFVTLTVFMSLAVFIIHIYTAIIEITSVLLISSFLKSQFLKERTELFDIIMKILLLFAFLVSILAYTLQFNELFLGGINFNFLSPMLTITYTHLMNPIFIVSPLMIFAVSFLESTDLETLVIKSISYVNLMLLAGILTCYTDFLRLNAFSSILSSIILGVFLGNLLIKIKIPKIISNIIKPSPKMMKKILYLTKIGLLLIISLSIAVGSTMNIFLKVSSTNRINFVNGIPSVYSYGEYEIGRYLALQFRGEKNILVVSDGATAATVSTIGLIDGWTPDPKAQVVSKLRNVLMDLLNTTINAAEILDIIGSTTNIDQYDYIFFVFSPKTYFYIIYGNFHKLPAEMPTNLTEYELISLNLYNSEGFTKVYEKDLCVLYRLQINSSES